MVMMLRIYPYDAAGVIIARLLLLNIFHTVANRNSIKNRRETMLLETSWNNVEATTEIKERTCRVKNILIKEQTRE